MVRSRLGRAACLAAILLNTGSLHAQESPADAQFKALYTREWTWRQHVGQTGEGDGDGDNRQHGVYPHLPKVDAATQQIKRTYWESVLRQLDALNPQQLSPANQVKFAVYRVQIQVLENSQRFRDYGMPLTSESGFWMQISGSNRRHLLSLEDYRNYISMLNDVPRFFDEEIANMQAGLARGFTPVGNAARAGCLGRSDC